MSAVHSIAAHGFDPAYSRVAVYGKGTYASPFVQTALDQRTLKTGSCDPALRGHNRQCF
jgi:hypothetical protein